MVREDLISHSDQTLILTQELLLFRSTKFIIISVQLKKMNSGSRKELKWNDPLKSQRVGKRDLIILF